MHMSGLRSETANRPNHIQLSEEQELSRIALTLVKGVGYAIAGHLLDLCGSPEQIFADREALKEKLNKRSAQRLLDAIYSPNAMEHAKRELDWIKRHGVEMHFISDANYPERLRQCIDAPILLYSKGRSPLDSPQMLSIVGTRNLTSYGNSLVESLIADLSQALPDLVIISGLAYGTDIAAHRAALAHGLPTIGVLAHGLDRIYPAIHRNDARRMLDCGGLLTSYPSGTNPDRFNFVSRNRIVAGLSDATLIIESAAKGGSLITARLAHDYDREVMAVPGRTTDKYSAGCNDLIKKQIASLVFNAADILELMGYKEQKQEKAIQTDLLFAGDQLPDTPLAACLKRHGSASINQIVKETGLSINEISTELFELELDGLIQALPGGMYAIL